MMKCTICSHSKRKEIESAVAAGASLRDVARQFETSKDAVARHKENCIKPAIQLVRQEQMLETGSRALDRLTRHENMVDEALEIAWYGETKDPNLLIRLLQVSTKQIELRAKLEGDLDERSITITAIPEWVELRSMLIDALAMHPQAKQAVIRALEAYDHAKSA
jgi:hypothetical protein